MYMMGKHLTRKILLGLLMTTMSGYAFAAGVYSPGTITDSDVTYVSGPPIIDQSGDYTIKNDAGDTLTITGKSSGSKIRESSGNNTVINGNITMNEVDNGNSVHPVEVKNQGSTLTINGNFKLNELTLDKNCGEQNEYISSAENGKIIFNKNVDIDLHNCSDEKLAGVSAIVARSGAEITINGNFHLKNTLDGYQGSHGGANGVWAKGDGAVLNFNGDETVIKTIGYKPDTITAKTKSTVNINSDVTQILGNIDFGDGNGGTVNTVLDGTDSYWYGDELNGDGSGTLNVTLKNGAEYIPFGTLSENKLGAKKYLSALDLEDGGIVDLYDAVALQKCKDSGLDGVYADLLMAKQDYIMIGDLKGTEGIFRLDINDTDKSKTDMIYILDSTAGAGQNNIESYSDDSFANISKSNTLRFATVASPAANKLIFKDKMNMYGKTLWDYSLLIGHSAYDVNDPENTVYNSSRDGLTADQLNNLMTGGMNWYIYGYTKTPNDSAQTVIDGADSGYDMATYLDRYNKRHGEAKYLDKDSNIWVRMQRGDMGRDGGYDGRYTMGQIGVEFGKEDNHYGVGFDYLDGTSHLSRSNGSVDNTRKGIMAYDTKTWDNGGYLDMVARYGKVYSDLDGYNRHSGEKVSGNYSDTTYGISAEYGRKFQQEGKKVFWEPQAQLQYTHINGTDFTTSNGIATTLDSANSLIGRLGFRVGRDWDKENTIYFKADILREFSGGQDYALSYGGSVLGDSVENRGTWYDVGFGADIKVAKKMYITCDFERSFGGELGRNWEANLGAKWVF
jgi:outer membrane autotransporter protein